jgi:hypothetical protein
MQSGSIARASEKAVPAARFISARQWAVYESVSSLQSRAVAMWFGEEPVSMRPR